MNSGTKRAIIVLILPEVSETGREQLKALGAQLILVEQLEYPFSEVPVIPINKECRYSKLHLWNQTQFKKIVFLDADTMIRRVTQTPKTVARIWHAS